MMFAKGSCLGFIVILQFTALLQLLTSGACRPAYRRLLWITYRAAADRRVFGCRQAGAIATPLPVRRIRAIHILVWEQIDGLNNRKTTKCQGQAGRARIAQAR